MERKPDTEYVYNRDVVVSAEMKEDFKHPFLYFLEKDYEGRTYEFSERILVTHCIDMDEVETAQPFPQNDNTMDLVVGVGRFNDTDRSFSNRRLFPVELKLNCESFYSLGKNRKGLISKDIHTRDLLKEHKTDYHSIFLFVKEVAPEAKRYLSQWQRESRKLFGHWMVMDPEQYNEYIGFEEDFPYKPLTNLDNIGRTLESFINNDDYESMIDWIEDWKNKAEEFKRRYKLRETAHIYSTVADAIECVMDRISREKEYIALQLDDFRSQRNLLSVGD